MISGCRVLAVVPARSGSKGIPDKNMRQVAGCTLIGHAGRVLAALNWLDRRIISTDSPAYAQEGKRHGLDAPFLRPEHISTDTAGAAETMAHALIECERIDKVRYDVLLIIEPTSPLRIPSDVERCVHALLESNADSAVTVSRVDTKFHPRKLLVMKADRLDFFQTDGSTLINRQQLTEQYVYRNGLCYALTRHCLLDHKRIITDHTVPVLVERPVVNIDEPFELELAQFLLTASSPWGQEEE